MRTAAWREGRGRRVVDGAQCDREQRAVQDPVVGGGPVEQFEVGRGGVRRRVEELMEDSLGEACVAFGAESFG